jgi:NAD(P)H-hydrate epimerase
MSADVSRPAFRTADGITVPAVTAAQMWEIDRIATDDFGLGILQMMENAGRGLAQNVLDVLQGNDGPVVVLVGSGGNGGGGLCCARHLHNRGLDVQIALSKEGDALTGAARTQLHTLQAAGLEPIAPFQVQGAIRRAQVVVDALIGYSLCGAPRGRVAELIDACNDGAAQVLSLDIPSGLDATTGSTPGRFVRADRTLTLALPKVGLRNVRGELYLADIGIPPQVYQQLGLIFEFPLQDRYWVRLFIEHGEGQDPSDRSHGLLR